MDKGRIVNTLYDMSNKKRLSDMNRFGINTSNALGISIYTLRSFAKEIGINHKLALDLWTTKIHEARILASLIDDPMEVSENQLEEWVLDFNSWDICDQCCSNLFDKTKFAYEKAIEWSYREEEFVKRAGFVLMACLSVHDKKAKNEEFIGFFSRIVDECVDDRNFVKKAVNWALRQIGKRNYELNKIAIKTGKKILENDSKSAQWIGNNALKELTSDKIIKRLKN